MEYVLIGLAIYIIILIIIYKISKNKQEKIYVEILADIVNIVDESIKDSDDYVKYPRYIVDLKYKINNEEKVNKFIFEKIPKTDEKILLLYNKKNGEILLKNKYRNEKDLFKEIISINIILILIFVMIGLLDYFGAYENRNIVYKIFDKRLTATQITKIVCYAFLIITCLYSTIKGLSLLIKTIGLKKDKSTKIINGKIIMIRNYYIPKGRMLTYYDVIRQERIIYTYIYEYYLKGKRYVKESGSWHNEIINLNKTTIPKYKVGDNVEIFINEKGRTEIVSELEKRIKYGWLFILLGILIILIIPLFSYSYVII